MYVRNGQEINIFEPQIIDDIQYGPNWFQEPAALADLGIEPVHYVAPPEISASQKLVGVGFEKDDEGRWVKKWSIVPKSAEELANDAAILAEAKAEKNLAINAARATANQSFFMHSGKKIQCDALSRSDIDAVANHIALMGTFPPSFPGAWKAMDNSYVMLPTVQAFKDMYVSMTAQGTANFAKSQSLKAACAAANKIEDVININWN